MKQLLVFLRFFFLFALLAGGLSACASAPTAPAGGLTIAVPRGVTADALKAYADWFGQQGGARAVIEQIGTDQYADQINAGLLSGADRYDLVYLPAESLGKWAGYHTLQPVALTNPQTLAPWLDIVTVDGQVYGIPTQPDPVVLWYRADLLQSANLQPPASWEAFRAAARALNHPPERYGAVIAGSEVDAAYPFSAVLAGFGGEAVGEDGRLAITGTAARGALALYAGLRADGVTPPQSGEFTTFEVISTLQNGRAALGIAPLSAGDTLLDCRSSPKVCAGEKPQMAYAWLPGLAKTEAVGSLGAWVIPLRAPHPQEAQAFAARLATVEGGRAWAAGGGVPALRDALRGSQVRGAEQLAALEHYRLAIPPLSTYEQALKAYHQAVHNAVAGTETPEQALDEAAVEMKKALRQGGY